MLEIELQHGLVLIFENISHLVRIFRYEAVHSLLNELLGIKSICEAVNKASVCFVLRWAKSFEAGGIFQIGDFYFIQNLSTRD